MKNRRKAVQPFEIKKRKIDIFRNYEANGFEKNQRKFENFSILISKKSIFMGTKHVRNMAFMIAGNIVESLGIRLVIKREKLEALGLTWSVK